MPAANKATYTKGDRVTVRSGDWGADNLGTIDGKVSKKESYQKGDRYMVVLDGEGEKAKPRQFHVDALSTVRAETEKKA